MTEDQTTTDTAAEIQIETREWVMRGEHIIDDPLEYTHELFVRHDDLPEIIAAYLNANVEPALAAKDTEIERLREELADLKASAVVLPEDWREQLVNVATSRLTDDEDVIELLRSWSASAVDGGGEKTLAELRAALAAPARPAPTEEPGETRKPHFNLGDVVRSRHTGNVLTVVEPLENWLPFYYELVRPASPQENSEASDGE